MKKRVFIIVLDSLGIGGAPDAKSFGDEGSDTLSAIQKSKYFDVPNLTELGLFNIDGVGFGGVKEPKGAFARMTEQSLGKDTTTGHWELAGLISKVAFPTYPDGFPEEIISRFERECGVKTLCNKPYSGTEVIKDYGKEHLKTGKLIVYTSADSVFQIAAHESIVPVEKLYEYCRIARKILVGKDGVGRVIARPFSGEYPFVRTVRRHDFSLLPPQDTLNDILLASGKSVISIGKIFDIFGGRGFTKSHATVGNADGMLKIKTVLDEDFEGLCFANLVDFDMLYGHRNDIDGYARAVTTFDCWLEEFMNGMNEDDLLLITADHGCDPSTPSTDHSRECVPLLAYARNIKSGANLGTLSTFADVAATVLDYFDIKNTALSGKSFLNKII